MADYFEIFGWSILTGILVAVFCSFVGTFVVIRRLSFLADTIGHSTLAGIGLGYFWGISPHLTVVPYSLLVALLLTWLARNRKQDLVASTAVIFSLSVSAGILLLSKTQSGSQELIHILFGDLLWIGRMDLLLLLLTGLPISIILWLARRRFVLMFIDENLAVASGIPTHRYDYMFMIFTAAVIAVSLKLVGIILVTGLITIPPMISARISHSLRQQFWLSPSIGAICALTGVGLALYLDFPAGASIVATCGLFYGITLLAFRPSH